MRWAMQLLLVTVQRGTAEMYHRSGLIISREQDLRYNAGTAVPVQISCVWGGSHIELVCSVQWRDTYTAPYPIYQRSLSPLFTTLRSLMCMAAVETRVGSESAKLCAANLLRCAHVARRRL